MLVHLLDIAGIPCPAFMAADNPWVSFPSQAGSFWGTQDGLNVNHAALPALKAKFAAAITCAAWLGVLWNWINLWIWIKAWWAFALLPS